MDRILSQTLALLAALALALAPRCLAPEEGPSFAAPDAGDARRAGAAPERPGSGAATPPSRTPGS